ncbi:DsbA family protein [Peterkaempfera bronchialis]|uniref:DsbA family protein n=1 Tax=Peterkaempfera bronchialis TaxID=2126346 RepID=UPI003C2D13AE
MPRYQHARVLRAALAAVALTAAVVGETAVGRALADRGAEETGRSALARAAMVQARDVPEGRASRAEAARRGALSGRPVGGPPEAPAVPGARPVADRAHGSELPAAAILRRLPARLDRDGATILIGSGRAPVTVTLYEDYRCPDCRRFEQAQGETLARLVADGTVLIRRVIESSLDVRLPGIGAQRAANAARAALASGRFPLYNAALYANQPPERQDGYTVARLLKIASQVPGLRGAAFDRAVRSQRYASWVRASQRVYDRYDRRVHSGTPGMEVNGRVVDLEKRMDLARDPEALRAFLLAAARD